MLLAYQALAEPLAFVDCPEVARGVDSILRGWGPRPLAAPGPARPAIRVRRTRNGYVCVSPRLSRPSLCREARRTDLLRAVGICHVELLYQYLARTPSLACLHAGAVACEKGLVVLAGTHRSGKSTLVAQLAALGHPVFGDDVVPIDPEGKGVSLGFVPRLRLPLPDDAGAALGSFLETRRGLDNGRNLYLDTRAGEVAPLGSARSVASVVVLEREPGAPAEIEAMAASEALSRLVVRNISRDQPAPDLLERLFLVVSGAACMRLRYGRSADAAVLLSEACGQNREAA